jgi:hypothetical protein
LEVSPSSEISSLFLMEPFFSESEVSPSSEQPC